MKKQSGDQEQEKSLVPTIEVLEEVDTGQELKDAGQKTRSAFSNAVRGNLLLMGSLSILGLRAGQKLLSQSGKETSKEQSLSKLEDAPGINRTYEEARRTTQKSLDNALSSNKRLFGSLGLFGGKLSKHAWVSTGRPTWMSGKKFALSALWAVLADAFGVETEHEIADYSTLLPEARTMQALGPGSENND